MEDTMPQNIDLKALEKKAWRSVFQDGLWDIYLGIILLSFAVSAWLDKQPIDDDLRMGTYIGVMVFGMIVLYAGKRFITIPRMGKVKFGAERQKRRNVVRLALFLSVLLGLALWWLGSSLLSNGQWVFPLIWMLNMFIVFGLGAYFLEYERLYLIGLLYALVIPVDIIVKATTKVDMDVYIFLTAGLIILVVGITYLIRFMRDNKPLDLNQG
jgi:hypothetical protein